MGTRIRTEVSKRKTYWLPKHRQLELVHFCLQYPEWKSRLRSLDGSPEKSASITTYSDKNGVISKPVERIVQERLILEERMLMIERAAKEAAFDLSEYLLRGITEGVGYDRLGVPCCKEVYYAFYRRFFWYLDKVRQ